MDQGQSTKWPQLGDPEFNFDVTITRAKYSYQMEEKDASLRMERYCMLWDLLIMKMMLPLIKCYLEK